MKRQEFDLRKYDLVVKDGKAVLERKGSEEPQVFKPGDVLISNGGDSIVIYAGTGDGGSIVTYVGYCTKNNNFTCNTNVGWGYTSKYLYANEEQKSVLFSEIEKRGYVWDAEKLELRNKRWRAKKGEEYWHCEFGQEVTRVFSSMEKGRDVDDFRYEQENYFMSEKDVIAEIEKVEQYKTRRK